ncbi:unnamed protein product [Polarella glacialis]|uniref:Uncharacterized protein n=1 Tax=Polarella glacialis TaxID=89957 RepID=A0A813E8J8_POLGL|nr:unnamed protein product [Polarella glacialis]
MLEQLVVEAACCGLELHAGKTKNLSSKVARSEAESAPKVVVGGLSEDILRFQGKTKYLGRQVSFNQTHKTEVDSRIKVAWGRFFANRDVLCNKAYPLQQRLRLFNSVVTPTILYGSGCWVLTQETASSLRKLRDGCFAPFSRREGVH